MLKEEGMRLFYLGGTVAKEDQMRLYRLLFRATRGKTFTQFFPMEVKKSDRMRGMKNHQEKVVYITMFQEGDFIKDRVQKICSSFEEPL